MHCSYSLFFQSSSAPCAGKLLVFVVYLCRAHFFKNYRYGMGLISLQHPSKHWVSAYSLDILTPVPAQTLKPPSIMISQSSTLTGYIKYHLTIVDARRQLKSGSNSSVHVYSLRLLWTQKPQRPSVCSKHFKCLVLPPRFRPLNITVPWHDELTTLALLLLR